MKRGEWQRGAKRAIDLGVGTIMLVLVAPLLVVIAILVRIDLGAPVLFSQRRPGFRGQLFTLWKFRTMRNARDQQGILLSDAERLTRFGRFLRRTSLDELPELVNVIRGDMSLVGPRPLLAEYLELYDAEQARRHDVKPGLTGWAQVKGRNAIPWPERLALDTWYVENWSLALDLRIIGLTVSTILTPSDVTQPGRATVDRFTGNHQRRDDKSAQDS